MPADFCFLQAAASITTGSALTSIRRIRPSPFFGPADKAIFKPRPFAFYRRAIFELHVHWLNPGVDVVDAYAGLVARVDGEFLDRRLIHIAKFGFHFTLR